MENLSAVPDSVDADVGRALADAQLCGWLLAVEEACALIASATARACTVSAVASRQRRLVHVTALRFGLTARSLGEPSAPLRAMRLERGAAASLPTSRYTSLACVSPALPASLAGVLLDEEDGADVAQVAARLSALRIEESNQTADSNIKPSAPTAPPATSTPVRRGRGFERGSEGVLKPASPSSPPRSAASSTPSTPATPSVRLTPDTAAARRLIAHALGPSPKR